MTHSGTNAGIKMPLWNTKCVCRDGRAALLLDENLSVIVVEGGRPACHPAASAAVEQKAFSSTSVQ